MSSNSGSRLPYWYAAIALHLLTDERAICDAILWVKVRKIARDYNALQFQCGYTAAMSTINTTTEWALNHLLGWYIRKRNPAYETIRRFRRLIEGHQITLPQILRLLPEDWHWTLAQIQDDEALLRALDTTKLLWFADRFGVDLGWLEGVGDQIYSPIWFYKNISSLPKQLQRRKLIHEDLDIVAFTDRQKPLDMRGAIGQDVAIVFSVPIAEIGDTTVRRYVVCGDGWIWDHEPCRFDLKMFARTANLEHFITIPIIPVSRLILDSLREGKLIPTPHIPSSIGRLERLEDFALAPRESKVARECEEIEDVLAYRGSQLRSFFDRA